MKGKPRESSQLEYRGVGPYANHPILMARRITSTDDTSGVYYHTVVFHARDDALMDQNPEIL